MTPPRGNRNFLLGVSRPIPDRALLPESAARRHAAAAAVSNDGIGVELSREAAVEALGLAPTIRYRPSLAEAYAVQSVEQLELYIHQSLQAARAGERVRYYDTLAAHFGLMQRVSPDRFPGVTRQFLAAAEEYSNFLQYAPGLSTEERMRFLFAAARIIHTYWGYLEHPPAGVTLPPGTAELRRLLGDALDEIDSQLQSYHVRLREEAFPDLPRLQGVVEIIALRRALHADDRDAQRSHALALADYLRNHPPVALDSGWEARAERGLLEDPAILHALANFDVPSLLEYRSATLNAYGLELVLLTAASLDRVNEEQESVVQGRYQRLSAVLTAVILRHPEHTLEEHWQRLLDPAEQAGLVAELQEMQSRNADIAGVLEAARGGQGLAELLVAAREAALHFNELRAGLGANLLPGMMEANRRHHPLRRLAAALEAFPPLASELGLPATHPERELLRRGRRGIAEVEAFHARHPEFAVTGLLGLLDADGHSPHPTEGFAREVLEATQERLSSAPDHEAFALFALAQAIAEDRELGLGVRLPAELRLRAASLGARMEGFEFRGRRVLGHLLSPTSLLAVGAGVLAAEFLPSLLIARAGASGSLAVRGFSLVAGGTLTVRGSLLNGLGTGLVMSAAGTTLHSLERARFGLDTHWSRDFLASGAVNLATFGLTLPVSALLRRRLLAATAGEVTALTQGQRALLHGGTVAFGGATAWGLGYLGRGLLSGQWEVSGEEIAENFGTLLLWEGGAAGLSRLRSRRNLNERLGAYRAPRVARFVDAMIAADGSLANRRDALLRWMGREEYHQPGTLARFESALSGGYRPQWAGEGHAGRLSLRPLEPAAEPAARPEPELRIVILERDRVLRLPANTESVSNSGRPRSDPPEGHPPPVSLEESPFRLEVASGPDSTFCESIQFADLAPQEGSAHRILGRGHFEFLPAPVRGTLSRNHLELGIAEDGALSVRNLSRTAAEGSEDEARHGSWYHRDGIRHAIPSDQAVTVLPSDLIALGTRSDPVRFRLRRNSTPPLSRITLGPGGRLRLRGLTLIRTGEASLFRLGGPGGIPVEILRSKGDEAGVPQGMESLNHPMLLGEIGEEVEVSIGAGADRRRYRLSLDAPDRPAAWLPRVDLHYSGTDQHLTFRSTSPSLDFGRAHQSGLFSASFISRNHFNLRIIAHQGQPRYGISVESPNGLFLDGRRLARGTHLALYAGSYELAFAMNASGSATDVPFRLELPPIEGTFEEWRTGPLAPDHDRGVAPAAPQPAPPNPSTTPPPAARRSVWDILRGLFD